VYAICADDLEDFEDAEGGEPERMETPVFVYEIAPEALPDSVVAALAKAAPNYKPAFSRTVGDTSWANVCVHCGVLQGAFFLHNEPDGPFFGGPEEADVSRTLLSDDGFDVDSASYTV